MNPGIVRLLIIGGYLLSLLGLSYFASRRSRGTKDDYLLASHSIGPFLLLMSLFGTTMTAFALVGSTGEAFKEGIGVYGMLASSSGIIHSLCFFVIGIKIWSFGRRYGYTTQIQFFRDRLDSDFIGVLLFPILVGLVIPYLLIGVLASGTVVQTMTAGAFPEIFPSEIKAVHGGIPPWLGSLAICLVVLTYVFFGGMRGTAWANAFQTIIFMVLGVVTFYVIANQLGKQATFLENLKEVQRGRFLRQSDAVRNVAVQVLHVSAGAVFGRHVPAPVSALADSQERPQFQIASGCPSDIYHDCLGSMHPDRYLGDYGSSSAGSTTSKDWHHKHRQFQCGIAVFDQDANGCSFGRPTDSRNLGGDHEFARQPVPLHRNDLQFRHCFALLRQRPLDRPPAGPCGSRIHYCDCRSHVRFQSDRT